MSCGPADRRDDLDWRMTAMYSRSFEIGSIAMTEKNRAERIGADSELTDDELNVVVGGAGKTPAPKKAPVSKSSGLFEVEDYSFDVEQTLNIGS
jgi:hypothetical protein